jgi:ABC-type lipoprotein release transport system permease subunit
MKTTRLIFKEMLHRKVNFLLGLLAVMTAVALFIFIRTTGEASKRETTRLMRDMGFNLRIVSKQTDIEKFWATGASEASMPEEYLYRFAKLKGISYNHLVAILRKRFSWQGGGILLTGISAEVAPLDKKKSPMIFSIERGTIYVGSEIHGRRNIKKGDQVDLFDRTFRVAACLSESGSEDDITIYAHLHDVQELLGMAGRINEIKALECLCRDPVKDSETVLKEQLEEILPDARVIQIKNIATAREKQRLMTENYFAMSIPFVLVVCAAWILVLAMMNVRDRRPEIGILRALGYGSGPIAWLFLGRAAVTGVVAAAAGFGIGTVLALVYGPDVFKVTAKAISPAYDLLLFVLVAAPLFASVCSLIPAMTAVTQDPAVTLREE